jgi:pimeloyl-ACP methyl ester carboxylesterase
MPCFSRKIETPSGLKVHVIERGSASLVCVLMHGIGDSAVIWNWFSNMLARHFRVIIIELRGHGESDWDKSRRYFLDDYVEDVEFALSSLKIEKHILVGHSLGGCIAAKIAARRRGKILRVVLVDISTSNDAEMAEYLKWKMLEGYKVYKSIFEYRRWLSDARPLASESVIDYLARNSLRETTLGLEPKFDKHVCDAILQNTSDAEMLDLEAINVPVLLVRGAGSAMLPKSLAEQLVCRLPKGKLATVELSGHAIMVDNPAGFSNAVMPFVRDALVAES